MVFPKIDLVHARLHNGYNALVRDSDAEKDALWSQLQTVYERENVQTPLFIYLECQCPE